MSRSSEPTLKLKEGEHDNHDLTSWRFAVIDSSNTCYTVRNDQRRYFFLVMQYLHQTHRSSHHRR